MKVTLSDYSGEKTVELADQRSRVGYEVTVDEENFFNPSEGVTVFIESPQVGAHPWVAYVRRNEDESFAFDGATRMPLEKTTIRRVFQ